MCLADCEIILELGLLIIIYHEFVSLNGELSSIRSRTFQAFCGALNFEYRIINKHAISTFVIVWSEILLFCVDCEEI